MLSLCRLYLKSRCATRATRATAPAARHAVDAVALHSVADVDPVVADVAVAAAVTGHV